MALLVAATYVAFAPWVMGFETETTVKNVLANSATEGLLAVALTIPLLAGEIDLSIGSNLALSGVVFVTLQPHHGVVIATVLAVAAGMGIGLLNGFLVSQVGANSFVATLAVLYLAQSVALVIAHGGSVAGTAIGLSLDMSKGLAGPITIPLLILAAVVLAAGVFVTRTVSGRDIVAIGGNREAAQLAGIPVVPRVYLAFILSGLIAAISGAQLAATTLNGAPASGGTNLLTAATAVFLGGVSLTGGRGSVLASALAVIALSTLNVGLQLAGISSGVQDLITGTALVLVIGVRAVSAGRQGRPIVPSYLRAGGFAWPRGAGRAG